MAEKIKRMTLGWYGDGGHGERVIAQILDLEKTATASLAYEMEDADILAGDRMILTDKRGKSYGTIYIVRIELRKMGAFTEELARDCGYASLAALREAARFANAREIKADEDMRITHFQLIGPGRK